MKTVLAAVDDSAASGPVIAMALALAPVLDARVEAVKVSSGPGQTARANAEALHVPFRTVVGDPVDVLAQLVDRDDVVALSVGARDSPSGRHRAGHVARNLADRTAKPVLVVPPDARTPDRIRTVLVAMEGTPARARSLKRAIDLASGAGLDLVVVHVDDETSIPSFSDQVHYEVEAYAREFLARYCRGAPTARLELRIGEPAEEILDTAATTGAEVLALGWPGPDPARGATAREVLDRSHVPVLLVALA